ncbi:heat shock protein 70 [Dacryopinax primogenitus]|uniref:Heat shock protein 70 n=1 Tax=Dacryopinax primogenitus (strain DJM 731) TaxID=1858805 RepID=M5G865_DACPD|nr:heat shock protein 70 [Dacryopinax primogenitus]EJU04335.1 heat shock protein 70 [Dacryopinax primogenitus]
MASVVGIDLGNLGSKVGVARQRGIDIVANEVSNRVTPSLISFGPKARAIGEAAKTMETGNFKNTIGSLKRLVGRSFADPEISEIEKKFINAQLVDASGTVGVSVLYCGEKQTFSATQLLAMYLARLGQIAAKELQQDVTDCVIAVPGWYTEVQRRAVLDSAFISGLNPLRLINDTTAVALGYGITKSDLPPPETPRNVVFVDIGHSNYSVAVVSFAQGQLTVKSTAYDRHFGGRDFDYALVQHFAEEFKGKYKIDVLGNPKATFRLATACERLKKMLSANQEAPLNVESIMNDVDASSKLNREQFETFIAPLLERVHVPLEEALREAQLTTADIHVIEIVGGSTRIPAIKQRIQDFFGKPVSATLNADEAVARGATFACAGLSPRFKLRAFTVNDIATYPIKVSWAPSPEDEGEEPQAVVFPRGNGIPSTKTLKFVRSGPFELEASYADPAALPGRINPWVGKVTIKSVGEAVPATVKVRARLNLHGIFSFESAFVETTQVVEEEVPSETAPAEGEAPVAPQKRQKKVVKKNDMPVIAGGLALDSSILNAQRELEGQMIAEDKLVQDTEDRKNALEEYIYDTRSKLDDRYATFVQPKEKEALGVKLAEAEDWLYTEEGEDAPKSSYVSRLDALKALGDPVAKRYMETEMRPRAAAALRETVNNYLSQAQSEDERFSHITPEDKQKVIEKAAGAQSWLENSLVKISERPKNVDPVITCAEIDKTRDELIYFANPIMTKPKPKADAPPAGANQPPPPPPPKDETMEPSEEAGPTVEEMDVD